MSQPINCASKYQPFPCFYVYRPGYLVVPLIPLDELPWWIQVGDFNWTDSALYESMLPASFNYFPRVGEYDVVCHHCYAHVDSLHRSVSERSNSNASSHTSNVPKGLGAVAPSKPAVLDHPYMLKHPPFEASFNTSPFVGMCFVKCPSLPWSIRSRRAREDDQNVNQDGHPGDHGSNNGSSHSMQVQGESSNNGSSHSMQTQEEQTTNGSDSVVVEYRPIVHEENSDATVPPVEEPMHFSISIDDNSHTPVEDNLIPDPRHSDTEVSYRALPPQLRTATQHSPASSPSPDPTSSESTLCERPRSRPLVHRSSRRHVRFAWPAGGLQPGIRRTGPTVGVIGR